jgi:hypothetical protein
VPKTKEQSPVETLRQTVERVHRSKAEFKEKVHVRLMDEGRLTWEGDVFVFDLLYDTRQAGATKEDIEAWKLPGPTAKALKAAEERGQSIREALQKAHADHGEPLRKAKVAYAWTSTAKGKKKPRIHTVAHRGEIKSPVDAVKHVVNKK